MYKLPKSIEDLATRLGQLPGIGPKTASRLAFYLVQNLHIDTAGLADAIANLRSSLTFCDECHNLTDVNPCVVCSDASRDRAMLCVVEEPMDVLAMDRAGFKGLYHVLGGQISPLEGIGPGDLQIESLARRVAEHPEITEIIVATNPDVEGEATASYLVKLLSVYDRSITRLARGLPMGGDLEYADELTLSRALEGRNQLVS
jgi:recombination protein RecR